MPAGNEYLSSNSFINYPFADDEKVPEWVKRLFCDALVTLDYGDSNEVTVANITHKRSFNYIEFDLYSGSNKIEHVQLFSDGNAYSVYRSKNAAFVINTEYMKSLGTVNFNEHARLSSSAVENETRKIESFSIYNHGYEGGSSITGISGAVSIRGGYNIGIDGSKDSVTISAAPGLGLGLYKCECEDESSVVWPPLFAPDGVTKIENDTCYDIFPKYLSDMSGEIEIHVKCTACCQCEDYLGQAEHLKELIEQARVIRTEIMSTIPDKYEAAVTEYNESLKKVLERDFTVTISGSLGTNGNHGNDLSYIVGLHNRLRITASVTNRSHYTARISVNEFRESGATERESLKWMYTLADGTEVSSGGSSLPVDIPVASGKTLKLTGYFVDRRKLLEIEDSIPYNAVIRASATVDRNTDPDYPIEHGVTVNLEKHIDIKP